MNARDFKKFKNGDIIYCELKERQPELGVARWIAVFEKTRGDSPENYKEYCSLLKERDTVGYGELMIGSAGKTMADEMRLATLAEREVMIEALRNDGRKSAGKILRIIARNEKRRNPEGKQAAPKQAPAQPTPEAPDQTEAPDELGKEGDPVKIDDELIYNIPEGYEFKGIENGQVILKKILNSYKLRFVMEATVKGECIQSAIDYTANIILNKIKNLYNETGGKIDVEIAKVVPSRRGLE